MNQKKYFQSSATKCAGGGTKKNTSKGKKGFPKKSRGRGGESGQVKRVKGSFGEKRRGGKGSKKGRALVEKVLLTEKGNKGP